jgi:ATP-dependent Zn protease
MSEPFQPTSQANTNGSTGQTPLSESELVELTATAFHEAGHAVMAVSLGRSIQKVTISPSRKSLGGIQLGTCEIKKGRFKTSHDPLEDDVLVLLAGMVAESRFTGKYCPAGASQDLREVAKRLCTRAASPAQHETLQRRMLAKTEHTLNDEILIEAIQAVALELLQRITISGRTVRHHFQQAQQRKR